MQLKLRLVDQTIGNWETPYALSRKPRTISLCNEILSSCNSFGHQIRILSIYRIHPQQIVPPFINL